MSMTLPFVSLRAFETVVRRRGFGRAAEELGVTQSAISQHVKSLEEWTGHQLLIRGSRETGPTAEGLLLSEAVKHGLGEIEDVCARLKSDKGRGTTLMISCPPGFAINWLFPRLLAFDQAHPDIPVSIATQSAPPDLRGGEIDAAIHYGPGGYAGLTAERLMSERVFPVCSPQLLRDGPPLKRVADLSRFTLLVDELLLSAGTAPTWEFWANSAGETIPTQIRKRRFGQSNLVVQAALQGLGVALGREPLVIDNLASGALVRPFPDIVVSQFSYWLVSPMHKTVPKALAAFRDWLMEEAQTQPDLPTQHPQWSELNVGLD